MQGALAEIAAMITFFTKLPARFTGVRAEQIAAVELATATRFAPLAGLFVALFGLAVITAAQIAGFGILVAVIVGMAAMMVLTGCLHEDGLADMADALGAANPERRLEIMRDSRIGVFGAAALWTALGLRVALLFELMAAGWGVLAGALVGAHAVSRMAALYLAYAVPSARAEGASASFGRPDTETFRQGVLIACIIAVLTIPAAGGFTGMLAALAAAAVVAIVMKRFAIRGFGGQTGDLIGATQQLSELALLAAVSIFI